jgi:hypothetical protein
MRNDSCGTCESCLSEFGYHLIHCGFSDCAYAYCDLCGITCIVGGWGDTNKPHQAPLRIQGTIQVETEPWLQPCACGGRFRSQSSPRCPHCASIHNLREERATGVPQSREQQSSAAPLQLPLVRLFFRQPTAQTFSPHSRILQAWILSSIPIVYPPLFLRIVLLESSTKDVGRESLPRGTEWEWLRVVA